MACQTAGFGDMKHNETRDLTALKLKGATVEPVLLPLQSQRLAQFTANGSNDARVAGCAKVVPEATLLGDSARLPHQGLRSHDSPSPRIITQNYSLLK